MGVFLKWRGDRLSPQWWGFWQADGRRHEVAVCRWRGTPPEKGCRSGDAVFERSRAEAESKFEMMRDGVRSKEDEVALVQRIHAARYGGRVRPVKIADLRARWDALPHKADLTEGRRARVHSVLGRFEAFMAENFPKIKEAGGLTAAHFKGFLDSVDASGVSARSWNDYLVILRGVLAKVDGQGAGFRDYLAKLPKRTENTIHRRPFDGDELDAILAAAAEVDPELRPVLVAAACTALRRGDVCRLRWNAVDMAEGFVTVKTSKTGETVEIPIFPPFMAVLKEAARKRKRGVPYVWPTIALAYARNADGLNHRLNRVLSAAGFAIPKRHGEAPSAGGGKYPAPEDAEAAEAMVEDGMEREGWRHASKAKARRILALHFEGRNGKEIAEALHLSRATVSEFLHAMEDAGRIALVSEPKRDTPARATLADAPDGEQRKQRGSLCGWHSFRTTFCTLALANGVPMEILQKITGHRTAEVVLRHYDRRGRAAMRKAIGNAMPKAIAGAVDGDTGAELPALSPQLADLLADASQADLAAVAALLKARRG